MEQAVVAVISLYLCYVHRFILDEQGKEALVLTGWDLGSSLANSRLSMSC